MVGTPLGLWCLCFAVSFFGPGGLWRLWKESPKKELCLMKLKLCSDVDLRVVHDQFFSGQ